MVAVSVEAQAKTADLCVRLFSELHFSCMIRELKGRSFGETTAK